jgi:hypothetical protein
MFGDRNLDFEDEQEELMVQLTELDKEIELMAAENEMYENFYLVKAQVGSSFVLIKMSTFAIWAYFICFWRLDV